MRYDLHLHSNASDGELSPDELVRLCKDCGLDVMALSDHDSIAGIASAKAEADRQGIGLIAGVELSAQFNGELHILGLGIDWNARAMVDFLKTQQERRKQRAYKLLEKLKRAGIKLNAGTVINFHDRKVASRAHFAKALVEAGAAKDMDEAFGRYLARGSACYVPRDKASLESCIEVITASGGMAIWAHPYKMGLPDHQLAALGQRLKALGVQGLEAYYPKSGPTAAKKMLALCKRLDLLPTYGSDFHSEDRGLPGMGFDEFDIPDNIYRIIKEFVI